MNDGLLAEKKALVTGAAAGLGAAIARVFAREGARLVLVDCNAEGIAAIGRETCASSLTADLAQASACSDVVSSAVGLLGGLDILVNNAAVLHFAHSTEVTPEMWDRTIAVNLSAPFHLSRAAIPHLLNAHGNIVSVASSGAIVGTAYTTAYSSAKAGLIHMTKCLAMEYAKQPIRINAIAPGAMRTDIGKGLTIPIDADAELIARYAGLRPAVDPAEIAELAAFVASSRASAIHGACLSADGGVTAG